MYYLAKNLTSNQKSNKVRIGGAYSKLQSNIRRKKLNGFEILKVLGEL